MKCPTCGRAIAWSAEFPERPFCSERCKLQDLAHWADGTYRVAAEPVNPATGAGDHNTDTSEY